MKPYAEMQPNEKQAYLKSLIEKVEAMVPDGHAFFLILAEVKDTGSQISYVGNVDRFDAKKVLRKAIEDLESEGY